MWTYFLLTLAIIACFNAIFALGFNLQFGHAGIMNLAYIVLVAAGAYGTAIASVGPAPPNAPTTHYLGGFGWVFPWNLLFGMACSTAFAVVLGLLAVRRLRHDYLALTLVAIGSGLLVLVSNDRNLFNGVTGILLIPGPWVNQLPPDWYQWVFLGIALLSLAVSYLVIARITSSPMGRLLHAIRDDEDAAASLGKDTFRRKMVAFLVGAAAAGLGGGLLAIYIGAWNVQGWQPSETTALLAAVLIGGRARNLGALIGSVIVLSVIATGTTFLPGIGDLVILPNLQGMAVGLLLLIFLWYRPQGILPQQKDKFAPAPVGDVRAVVNNGSRPIPEVAESPRER